MKSKADNADFTGFSHPVLAVPCEQCGARVGSMCKRPSEHVAADFHDSRKQLADKVFIEQHGETAAIKNTDSGWCIDPNGYTPKSEQIEIDLP